MLEMLFILTAGGYMYIAVQIKQYTKNKWVLSCINFTSTKLAPKNSCENGLQSEHLKNCIWSKC